MSTIPADREPLMSVIRPLCQDVAPDILQDFLSRMDQEYFRHFDLATMAEHICLAAQLTPEQPCRVAVTKHADGRFDLTLVAYDYFSEFATICGLPHRAIHCHASS